MVKQNRVVELDDTGSWSATTEEFLALIHRATDLMRDNHSEEAKQTLERAFETRTDDPSSQATLGLVYFKLGIYPRAVAIYQNLVKDFPEEPTLRLNLGLVYLKTGQTEKAARELETVVKLAPEYRKASGYLGLAYQRLGDYLAAKRAFERAGAKHLARRMNRFIEPVSDASRNETESKSGDLDLGLPKADQTADEDDNGMSQELAGFVEELPFTAIAPGPLMKNTQSPKEPISVSELSAGARLPEPLNSRFLISDAGYLLMDIETRGYSRLRGLHFLTAEQIAYTPLKRRYRGRTCDELFGKSDNPMFEIKGAGRLGFHPTAWVFSAVSLDGEAVFVKERYLFAMDASLTYENGRIPGDGDMLVHLSGRGAFVLQTPTAPNSLEVTPKKGVIIPGDDLVGWFGRLLPRPTPKGPFDPQLSPLELMGEGVVLFCLP